MPPTMRKQLEHAVYTCLAYGDSKRSDKFNDAIDTDWKLYSRTYKRDILDLARNFGKFLSTAYPSIKFAHQISGREIQAYLDSKAPTCTSGTLAKLHTHISKIENCCKQTYKKARFSWHTDTVTLPASTKNADFVKDTPVPLEVSKTIIATLQGRRSEVSHAVTLSTYAGMRAEETTCMKVKNLHLSGGEFGFGYVTIAKGPEGGAKGGRPRTIPILNQEAQDALKSVTAGKAPEEYVAAKADGTKMTPDNVQRSLREVMDKQFGHIYKGNRNHGMRKAWAQRYYDAVRNGGCTRKQAVEKTNEVLGHGSNRGEVMVKMYVANIW